jgi:hypothetical protein
MSKWGVVHNEADSSRHVVPCDQSGVVLPHHQTVKDCQCCKYEVKEGFIVHKDPERGGVNA